MSVWITTLVFLALSCGRSSAEADSPVASVSKVATAWFAGWHANAGFPVSEVSWDKYTELTYAFA